MGFVIAKQDVYLRPEDGGFRRGGEKFDYNGPDNEHLEAIDKGPYFGYGIGELKDELTRRGIEIPPDASHGNLNNLLAGYDATQASTPIVARKVVPAQVSSKGDLILSPPYTDANTDALKAEAKKRNIDIPKNASDGDLRSLLVKDDQKPPVQKVEIVPTGTSDSTGKVADNSRS